MNRRLSITFVVALMSTPWIAWSLTSPQVDPEEQLERNRQRWEELDETQREELRRKHARLKSLAESERQRLENRQQYLIDLKSRVFEQLDPVEQQRLEELPAPERRRLWNEILKPTLAEIEREVAEWLPEAEWETLSSLPEIERIQKLEDFLVEETRRTLASLAPNRPLPAPSDWRRDPDRHLRSFLDDRKREFLSQPPPYFIAGLSEMEQGRARRLSSERFFSFLRRRFPDRLQLDFPPRPPSDRLPFALTTRQRARIDSLPETQREGARRRQSDANFQRFLEQHEVKPERIRLLLRRPVAERAALAERILGSRRPPRRDARPPLVTRLSHLTREQREQVDSMPAEQHRPEGRRFARENLRRALVERFELSEQEAMRWAELPPVELERRLRRRLEELGRDWDGR